MLKTYVKPFMSRFILGLFCLFWQMWVFLEILLLPVFLILVKYLCIIFLKKTNEQILGKIGFSSDGRTHGLMETICALLGLLTSITFVFGSMVWDLLNHAFLSRSPNSILCYKTHSLPTTLITSHVESKSIFWTKIVNLWLTWKWVSSPCPP